MTYGWHIAAISISAVLSVLFPIGLLFFVKRISGKIHWRHVLAGVIIFAVFQIFTRIPLLTWLQGQSWFIIYIASERLLMLFFLSFTAGLFEEVGRYLAFAFFRKRGYRPSEIFAYGVGHGGFESIALVGINTLAILVATLYLAFGWFGDLIIGNPQIFGSVPALNSIISGNPAYVFLLGGLERVFAILLHIGLSFVVAKGVYGRKLRMLFLAILLHTGVNFIGVLMPNPLAAEGFLLLVALVSIWYIRNSYYNSFQYEMGDLI